MTQAKHTPGPFRAIVRANQLGPRWVAVDMPRRGRSWSPNGSVNLTADDVADAHLFAAAPNMLAALRDMIEAFRPFTMKPIGEDGSPARMEQEAQNRAHRLAKAAIAKAEGRS